jgi:hypothetical protein
VTGIGTVLFLVLCVLVFRALGNPARSAEGGWTAPGTTWEAVARRWAREVAEGARVLVRLDQARRDRLGRPWT